MLTVKGSYRDGKIQLAEPVQHKESQVLVIFLDDDTTAQNQSNEDWAAFNTLIADCQMETGIADLAHQHDHYQHGSPKQELD
jgi:hypothetical protein